MWERSETNKGVPFYISHEDAETQWEHPTLLEATKKSDSFNFIRLAAYRTAAKIRAVQKTIHVCDLELKTVEDFFQINDYEERMKIHDVEILLRKIYSFQRSRSNEDYYGNKEAAELTLNWIVLLLDRDRNGILDARDVEIVLILLSSGSITHKYRYLFKRLQNTSGLLLTPACRSFLELCTKVPAQLDEEKAFPESSVGATVTQIMEQTASQEYATEDEFVQWMLKEPQLVVWLPTLHRFASAETTQHDVKCNICKEYPIVGFRYKCLKCFNIDICQDCFWTGRLGTGHKKSHPVQEYCATSSQTENLKDFSKVIKNKLIHGKKRRAPKSRYLPTSPHVNAPHSSPARPRQSSPPRSSPTRSSPTRSPRPSPIRGAASTSNMMMDARHSLDTSTEMKTSRERSASFDISFDQTSYLDDYDDHVMSSSPDRRRGEMSATSSQQYKMPPWVSADQKEELEKIIVSLEKDNRTLEQEVLCLQNEQKEFQRRHHTDSTEHRRHIQALESGKEKVAAKQEILETHNRHLELQLQKLRMLLQQDRLQDDYSPQSTMPSMMSDVVGSSSVEPYSASISPSLFHDITPVNSPLCTSNASLTANVFQRSCLMEEPLYEGTVFRKPFIKESFSLEDEDKMARNSFDLYTLECNNNDNCHTSAAASTFCLSPCTDITATLSRELARNLSFRPDNPSHRFALPVDPRCRLEYAN